MCNVHLGKKVQYTSVSAGEMKNVTKDDMPFTADKVHAHTNSSSLLKEISKNLT